MPSNKSDLFLSSRYSASRKEHYDKISKWYDLLAFPEKKHIEQGLNYLDIQEGEKVLEIGFGTGNALLILTKQVGNFGKVYGIDISPEMARISKSKLEKVDCLEKTELIVGDALELPFKAKFLDVIFMSFTLELFSDSEIYLLLNQCREILKTGGRLGVVSLSKRGTTNIIKNLYEWLNYKFPSYVDCRLINSKNKLEKAGFKVKKLKKASMWGLGVDIVVAVK